MDAPASPLLSGALSLQQLRPADGGLSRIGALPPSDIERVAHDFEKMALTEMLSLAMSETDVSDTLFGGGPGERMMRPFLIEQYASSFAASGGIGIASSVRAELLRMQEAGQASQAR